jgi:DNA-binding protein|uniref:RNA-binding protein n=1 Tax=candidate division WOR-3 bacterium TaxID=2052148 RepID=A0A7V3NV15_UNCW3
MDDTVSTREQKVKVIIGSKPLINYVTACVTILNSGSDKVILRARGKAINNMVEVFLLLRNSFFKNIQIKGYNIDCEEIIFYDGKKVSLPVLELFLSTRD